MRTVVAGQKGIYLGCGEGTQEVHGVLSAVGFAYRPAEEERVEDLTEDDLELRKADVATHFYRYLQDMADQAQFIVIENHKSDQAVVTPYENYQFTKNPNIGRLGLFV